MKRGNRQARTSWKVLPLVIMLILVVTAVASCGTDETEEAKTTESAVKLPPGMTEADLAETTPEKAPGPGEDAAGEEVEEEGEPAPGAPAGPGVSADLVGGRFTVTNASRQENNADVISGDAREVNGDYLEVELEIQNVGDDLIDLSHYSFRLDSPGIAAGTYSDYYGNNGTFGAYVSENVISATLLDYADLQPAGYVLKMGELVDKVFLFFDLNPESVAGNEGVTRDNSKLIIRKVEGSDYGEEVEISLAGYPDF